MATEMQIETKTEKTMTEGVVEKTLHFEASRERVWKAITDPAELAMWFGDEAEFDLRVGGHGAMIWEKHGRYEMRVDEVEAPRRLVWSWIHESDVAFDDAPATRVEWNLTEREGGGTTLYLRESGFLTDLHHEQNTNGWKHELGELEELLSAD
ncbi:MAG TPA: ATPase [Gemmatimonadetes bacterium]|nr:ATPase [Gemmatimonadota bacterium]